MQVEILLYLMEQEAVKTLILNKQDILQLLLMKDGLAGR